MVRQRARTSGEFAMNAIQTEMLYVQHRLAATRAMADAAAGPCARAAHETLARLYAARLDALAATVLCLIAEPAVATPRRAVLPVLAPALRRGTLRPRMTLKLAS
ncbi:hypothetical protein EV283_0270 [Sphingomonas sp. BK036]|nr:hypothetical protein EV283_0270 [Sphingomonas sp. BK036]